MLNRTISFGVSVCFVFMLLVVGRAHAAGDHSMHKRAMHKSDLKRSVEDYSVPDLTLIDQDGKRLNFKNYLQTDKPLFLNFLFATCTTICPVLAAGFSSFKRELAADAKDVRMVSISIDPEHDTPEVLKEYAGRFNAPADWGFLTGSREDIGTVMKAFDAYVSDKMNHMPLTFIKAPGNDKWVRIYGLMSTADHMAEYHKIHK